MRNINRSQPELKKMQKTTQQYKTHYERDIEVPEGTVTKQQ